MGTWGTAIFADDVASDVRDEYRTLLSLGKSDDEVAKLLVDYYYGDCRGTEDEPVFWFALALSQWEYGRLTEDVRAMAIRMIDSGVDLPRWNTPDNQKLHNERIRKLAELKLKLLSPMPKRKTPVKPKLVRSPWKIGDLLAYRLLDNRVRDTEYFGRYALIRVLQIVTQTYSVIAHEAAHSESILFGVYGWSGEKVPSSEVVNGLPYIPMTYYQDRVLGSQFEVYGNFAWSTADLRRLEIAVIDNDPSYATVLPEFFHQHKGGLSVLFAGQLDAAIVRALKTYAMDTSDN